MSPQPERRRPIGPAEAAFIGLEQARNDARRARRTGGAAKVAFRRLLAVIAADDPSTPRPSDQAAHARVVRP